MPELPPCSTMTVGEPVPQQLYARRAPFTSMVGFVGSSVVVVVAGTVVAVVSANVVDGMVVLVVSVTVVDVDVVVSADSERAAEHPPAISSVGSTKARSSCRLTVPHLFLLLRNTLRNRNLRVKRNRPPPISGDMHDR